MYKPSNIEKLLALEFIKNEGGMIMATMEYTREARCLDCKYYVPAPKPFTKSMCGLTEKPTNRKSLVCKDWKLKYY